MSARLHKAEPPYPAVFCRGGGGERNRTRELLGQISRSLKYHLGRIGGFAERVANVSRRDLSQRRYPHHIVDVEAVTHCGGNASRRGVRLRKIALSGKLSHVIAHGCRGNPKPCSAEQRLGAYRLAALDEALDDGGENRFFSRGRGHICSSLFFRFSTPRCRVLIDFIITIPPKSEKVKGFAKNIFQITNISLPVHN